MDLMMSICEQIFVLDFGKVISSGTPAQVQADPAVTAAYLGENDEDGSAEHATLPPGRGRRPAAPGAARTSPRPSRRLRTG